jgi:hypothetical protein
MIEKNIGLRIHGLIGFMRYASIMKVRRLNE